MDHLGRCVRAARARVSGGGDGRLARRTNPIQPTDPTPADAVYAKDCLKAGYPVLVWACEQCPARLTQPVEWTRSKDGIVVKSFTVPLHECSHARYLGEESGFTSYRRYDRVRVIQAAQFAPTRDPAAGDAESVDTVGG
jgi:hypothetical protein